jgi:antitoxin StbD
METMLADYTVSVTELKRNFAHVLSSAGHEPVAILNHNKPEAYLLSASHYSALLQRLEEAEDRQLVKERANGPFVEIDLNEL